VARRPRHQDREYQTELVPVTKPTAQLNQQLCLPHPRPGRVRQLSSSLAPGIGALARDTMADGSGVRSDLEMPARREPGARVELAERVLREARKIGA
jgi:hypothetical protein